MIKLGLFVLMLYALPEADSVLTHQQIMRQLWRVSAPSRVQAARGSCLVVPCNYTFPQTFRKIKTYRGQWKKSGTNVAATRPATFIHPAYRGRTRFLGPVWLKNCTWMLSGVRDSDAGKYYFRVELPEYDRYEWIYQPTEVQVIDPTPPGLRVSRDGAGISAICWVLHSCPKHPPALSWSHSGAVVSGSHQLEDWQWITFSHLRFGPELQDAVEIRCTVTYPGGKVLHSTVSSDPHERS